MALGQQLGRKRAAMAAETNGKGRNAAPSDYDLARERAGRRRYAFLIFSSILNTPFVEPTKRRL